MKVIKYQFRKNNNKNYSIFENLINYLLLVISIIFFMIFNSIRYTYTNPIKIINILISTYEFLIISIIFVIYIIFKICWKKDFYNPNLLIPCNYFFIIASTSLNFSLIFSLFNNKVNKKMLIQNITFFRFFLFSGILDCLFIFCITYLFLENKKVKKKMNILIFIIVYGALSLNLLVFSDPEAHWPNIHYNNYIIYFIILVMLYIANN